jgi:threonine aldolase
MTFSEPQAMSNPVDLRSDTVTRPSAAMREAMHAAPVGDDVFDEDPTIHALQDRGAALLGMEAALYVPSGTMANQLALLVHCRSGDDVLAGYGAHIYMYESGAGSAIAGVNFSVIGNGGHFTADDVAESVKQTDAAGHIPPTTLVCVENTHNRGGGLVMDPETYAGISRACHDRDLMLHLDGARLFNAAVAAGVSPAAWGEHSDTVSICLSKGLGAPVGSLLCGSREMIRRAHRYRKMLGGGMRQAGVIAAGGLYALDHHIEGLADDHRRTRALAEVVATCRRAHVDLDRVMSNILIFDVEGATAAEYCDRLKEDALVLPVGPQSIRAVFHRDVDDAGAERAMDAIRRELSA